MRVEPEPWWVTPAIVAAVLTLTGTLATIAYNGLRARRDRQREVFARAFAAVADYWEFPYVVRRRRPDEPEAERGRISEALRDVQRQLSFFQAWISIEAPRVAEAYDDLVATTRQIMGGQIREGWNAPPARSDADMNIADIRRDGLDDKSVAYLAAVRDHLVPLPWLRRAGRRIAARVSLAIGWARVRSGRRTGDGDRAAA